MSIDNEDVEVDRDADSYEYCPRCQANLTYQKGYSNMMPYWICKGCGEMLINPETPADDNVVWICDECGEMLNIQSGFSNNCGTWKCLSCGFINKIDESEIYLSDDEYRQDIQSVYKGLTDQEILELMEYKDVAYINGNEHVMLVERETDSCEQSENISKKGGKYIKKILRRYDESIYRYIKDHPISNMPMIYKLYEGRNNLIVIEEYISGKTISEILEQGVIPLKQVLFISQSICKVLIELQSLDRPIIHRDIKPSNVMVSDNGKVYLLDINAAKWYSTEKNQDTKMLGTLYFAAPEQVGYGFNASSCKTDIYGLGVLMNVMLTGKLPREEKATGKIWDIINRCISLEAGERYSAEELLDILEKI